MRTPSFILKKLLKRDSIGDIADVKIVDVTFENDSILKVGSLSGITNIGLKQTREKFLKGGIALEVVPKRRKRFWSYK